jgi:hypothetical protein
VDHPNCRDHANNPSILRILTVDGSTEVLSHGSVDKGEFDRIRPRHVVEQQPYEIRKSLKYV